MNVIVSTKWGERLIDVRALGAGPIADGLVASAAGDAARVELPSRAPLALYAGQSVKHREQLELEGRLSPGDVDGDVLELAMGERVRVELGDLAYELRCADAPPKVKAEPLAEQDFRFFKIAAMALLVLIAAIAAIAVTPQGEGLLDENAFGNAAEIAKRPIVAEVIKMPKISLPRQVDAYRGPEGKLGDLNAKQDKAAASKDKGRVHGNDRETKLAEVKNAGLLPFLDSGDAARTVFGGGGLGNGINNALGGLGNSNNMGDARGVGGMGSRGSDWGGGGNNLSIGGLNPGGRRGPPTFGVPGGEGSGHQVVVPPEGPKHFGDGLSRDVIMSVVRRHMSEIKFCYENELQKNKDLGGKVSVMWTIDPTGGVSEANVAESTIDNGSVESCMVAKIRRWHFPEPKGGGVVAVTFPWVFHAAGDDSE